MKISILKDELLVKIVGAVETDADVQGLRENLGEEIREGDIVPRDMARSSLNRIEVIAQPQKSSTFQKLGI